MISQNAGAWHAVADPEVEILPSILRSHLFLKHLENPSLGPPGLNTSLKHFDRKNRAQMELQAELELKGGLL